MLLSIIFSLISRKKHLIFSCFFSILLLNIIFFSSNIKKIEFIKKYTIEIPKYSDNDIFITSKKNTNILNPVVFNFPYKEKIATHNDVLEVSNLIANQQSFIKTERNPEILVISLKKDVSSQKWLNTFETNPEYSAVHSSHYRYLFNKAIIARNDALYSFFYLLNLISIGSFMGIIIISSILPIKLRKYIYLLVLDNNKPSTIVLYFSLCISLIACAASLVSLFFFSLKTAIALAFMLFIKSLFTEISVILTTSILLIFIGRNNYAKNRIL